MTHLLKTLIISSPNVKDGEAKIITNLFDAGLERFHLRKPHCSSSKIARILDVIPREFHDKIVLHRNFELLQDYALGGYHHKSYETLREVNGSKSRSTHKIGELFVENEVMDYLFFGPVFHSISKKEHIPKISMDEIRKALTKLKKNSKRPLVYALGGIRRNKVYSIIEAGFDGVALLGSIWGKPDPVAAFELFKASLDKRFEFADTLAKL